MKYIFHFMLSIVDISFRHLYFHLKTCLSLMLEMLYRPKLQLKGSLNKRDKILIHITYAEFCQQNSIRNYVICSLNDRKTK